MVSWLVVLGLTVFSDSVSVYIVYTVSQGGGGGGGEEKS